MSERSAAPVTVLVADDEPDIVALISRRLVKAGYRVITAANGGEALQRAQEELPAVAVLDVMMPLMTGIEVSRRLRSLPATHDMPVILISAGLPDKLVVPADADAFISKPFGPMEVPLMVRAVLERPARSAGDSFLPAPLVGGDA
jgi:CheY-like chemotaxis protein